MKIVTNFNNAQDILYFLRFEILAMLPFTNTIYRSRLLYILRQICKKKYSQVRSCLNRLIAYFHNINFL